MHWKQTKAKAGWMQLQGACSTVRMGWWALSIQNWKWRQCLGLIARGSCVGPILRLISNQGSPACHVLEVKPTGQHGAHINSWRRFINTIVWNLYPPKHLIWCWLFLVFVVHLPHLLSWIDLQSLYMNKMF